MMARSISVRLSAFASLRYAGVSITVCIGTIYGSAGEIARRGWRHAPRCRQRSLDDILVSWAGKSRASPLWTVSLRITHPKQLAREHRVIIGSGVRRQATPTTLNADSDSLGQASTARPCLAASAHRHGSS